MSDEAASLIDHPPGMTAIQVHQALGISEHTRRQLVDDGVLVPVAVGRRKLYPRWQVFELLGMVDPDVAAAQAVRDAVTTNAETPPEVDDASDNLVHLDSPRIEDAHAI